MTPRYVFWKCPYCEKEYMENDCYGGGKYCAVETSNAQIKGREIILEDLRQKCLYQMNYNDTKKRHIWWDYIQSIHVNCYDILNEECSKKAHDRLGLSFTDTQKCVMDSFTSNDWDKNTTNNTIIDAEIDYWKKYS